ncbi:MAG: hypothetical protein QFX32_06085 [Methanolinea sp.]|nr:hypothetical protein [Methanolinea sp.]
MNRTGSPGTRENAPIIPAAGGTHGILRAVNEETSAPGSPGSAGAATACRGETSSPPAPARARSGPPRPVLPPARAGEPFRERRPRFRAAEHGAVRALAREGFPVVVRVTDPRFPGNVIAWTERGGIHLFRVIATRRRSIDARAAAAAYAAEIAALAAVPLPPGGSRNLWVRSGRTSWKLFRVFPGGLAEVPHVA